jgi:hypothetical protein
MAAAVAAHDVQDGNGAGPSHQRGAGRGQRGGDPGRDPVSYIVHPRRGPAEPQVTGRTVPHHRVEGVDRAVGHQSRYPGDGSPEQRRHHGVRGVLGDRLHHRAGHPRAVQRRRIAPAEARQHCPGRGEIAAAERRAGPFGFTMQRPGPGDRPHRGRDRYRLPRRPASRTAVQGHGGGGDGQHAGGRVRGAAAAAVGVVAGLECRGGPAERGHRMTPARVADQGVERHAGDQPGGDGPSRSFRHQLIVA